MRVFKAHRHAVYHCLKEVQKLFWHAIVFLKRAFRHARVRFFKRAFSPIWVVLEEGVFAGMYTSGRNYQTNSFLRVILCNDRDLITSFFCNDAAIISPRLFLCNGESHSLHTKKIGFPSAISWRALDGPVSLTIFVSLGMMLDSTATPCFWAKRVLFGNFSCLPC